jgi:amino acid adenylation domain-containing protein
VIDSFQRAVRLHGDSVAVVHDGATRTFATLHRDVEAVAATVAEHAPPNAAVALSVPPSFGLAAGMLGVLMAERVLLVLDPAQPEARRRLLLRESGARLVLTGAGGTTTSGGLDIEAEVIPAGDDPAPVLPEPTRNEDRAAYLSFTSGSTGTPKCVIGSHQGLVHFLSWQRETFGIGPGDRGAQLTSLSFDVLYRDVLLPLVSGGTLCIPPSSARRDPNRLFAWLRTEQITYLHAVPSVTRAWLSEPYADRAVPTLRRVFFAGEPLPGMLVDELRRRVCAAEIVNLYGPTETTLAKLAHEVPPGDISGTVHVGRPLPGAQALVFGPHGRLCSIGEPGEVVLRTPVRSLGYLNAAPEERRRFFVNPFTNDRDDVLFRTGDRGRYRPDGTLDLLGRLDDQLKVRGIRIEPGEIESVLCLHPAVRNAAVAVHRGGDDTAGLAAYLEGAPGDLDVSSLRSFLAGRLPAHLLPGAFYQVDRIPVTASGKVDRRALADFPAGRLTSDKPHRAPRTPTEMTLVGIWSRVLGVRRIGVDDNFFELGGDSLRLVHVTSLAHDHGIPLDLHDYYERQTVSELGAVAESRRGAAGPVRGGPLARLKPDGSGRPIFCVHPSGGSAAWYVALARALPHDRPLFAFEMPGSHGIGEPLDSIEALADEYVRHLLLAQPTGPYALLGWSLGGMIAFEMAHRLTAAGHQVAPLILLEPTLPGDEDSAAGHRLVAEHYRTARELVERALAAPAGSRERDRRRADIVRFFDSIGWPADEAALADDLPLRACGLLHEAYLGYRPDPYDGDVHLVLTEEGRRASKDHRSSVLHDSAERYLRRWWQLVGRTLHVHDSGADHMTMVGPGNAADLAGLCERLIEEPAGARSGSNAT